MQRIEDALAAQTTATEARFAQGDANVSGVVTALEARLGESEKRLADALTAVSSAMTGVEQRLHDAEARAQQAALAQPPAAAAPTQGSMPVPGTPPVQAAPGLAGPSGGIASDPWANFVPPGTTSAQPTQFTPTGTRAQPSQYQGYAVRGGEGLKSKDFAHIVAFDGDLVKFPDWADRMAAKLGRAHPRLASILTWAEGRSEAITEAVEENMSEPDIDLIEISRGIFDILMERTGPRLFDKRRNAGQGRGLEFWRVLKRDFGTESTDAQLAKLQLYVKPGKCASVQALGEALDRWEALGRELTRPVDDDFRLLALRELVPKSMADMMSTQAALRSFPEAMMFVRRQVAEQRHASQVQLVQRQAQQGHAPMDLSVLLAAIANLRGEGTETPEEDSGGPASDLDVILAALKGKGKGKGKSKGKGEDRECYNCGKVGHLSRDCLSARPPKGDGKGKGKDGKGKGWALHHLMGHAENADDEPMISIGCLVRVAVGTTLAAVSAEQAETWQGHECIEALLDSGAGECVCGPQHFAGVSTNSAAGRAGAGVEYVCADGGRIPNLGEKLVGGVSDEGHKLSINFQVACVDRPLIAVSKLTAAGHDVWFGKTHGVITHGATGQSTVFAKKNGVYVLKVWAPRPAVARAPLSGGTGQ
jgi:hypothetical protein